MLLTLHRFKATMYMREGSTSCFHGALYRPPLDSFTGGMSMMRLRALCGATLPVAVIDASVTGVATIGTELQQPRSAVANERRS
jgi:hypothetical protein